MAHFLAYWKPDTVVGDEADPKVKHAASDQFMKVGVGDVLWIVTSEEADDLVLVGRMKVDRIVGKLEAEHILRRGNLWEADYHAISDSPEDKALLDISRYAPELSFDGGVDSLPSGFTGKNLQTMRRLDYSGEALMERLWARRNEA